MANKITYLLGAGASAQALPLIKGVRSDNTEIEKTGIGRGLPVELSEFANEYKDEFVNNDDFQKNAFSKRKPLQEIAKDCIEFGTPDLYAKYLLETGDDDNYLQLKILISNYFRLKEHSTVLDEAYRHGAFDKRALSFLTTISTDKKLNENIKIISWNYDTQIEIAANKLRLKKANPNELISGFASWPNIPNPNYNGEYFLMHLNGIAGYNYDTAHLAQRTENHLRFDYDKEPLLSFAWENDDNISKKTFTQNRLKVACNLAEGTTILVVIGYSFPFFNREIDNIVINHMRKTLKKIYFQDPSLTGDFLYDQFNLPREDDDYFIGGQNRFKIPIKHISNVDQYYVPYEL